MPELYILPRITVIMPSYNLASFIPESINSVLGHSYPELELWVIDGGSTDGTVEILRKIKNPRLKWLSEPDNGQADAINKGFRMASGTILTWLNADDLYEPDALSKVGHFFAAHPQIQWVIGQCSIIDEPGKEIRKFISAYKIWRLSRYSYQALLSENFIPQMGVFFRKGAIQEVGGVDASLHYAMDYDLWLRLGKRYEPGFIREKIAKFRMHAATKSITGFHRQFQEDFDVARKYAGKNHWPIFLHRINRFKIVIIYQLMIMMRQLSRIFYTAR